MPESDAELIRNLRDKLVYVHGYKYNDTLVVRLGEIASKLEDGKNFQKQYGSLPEHFPYPHG